MLNDLKNSTTGTGDRYNDFAVVQTINDVMHYYERELNSFYQGYLSTTITINLLAGVNTYPLGITFRSPIYTVRRTIATIDYFLDEMGPYNSIYQTTPVDNGLWLPPYTLEGNSIVFAYAPTSNETAGVRVKHQLMLPNLTTLVSTLNDQMYDAEDCIVIRSAVRLLRAKDVSGAFKNTTGWDKELQDAEKNFYCQVGNRYVKPDRPIPLAYNDDVYF